jgi:hypothetical protein
LLDACSGESPPSIHRTTLQHRARGRRSREEKDQGKQYLYPWEEKVLVRFLALQDALGRSVPVKYVCSIAFSLACKRDPGDRPSDPPNKNWPQFLYKRSSKLAASRRQALDWKRFDIYKKAVHWFEVIEQVLQRPDVHPHNVYNMDETGTLLSLPKSAKVVVSKDNKKGSRGARINRTNVIAIECVSLLSSSRVRRRSIATLGNM